MTRDEFNQHHQKVRYELAQVRILYARLRDKDEWYEYATMLLDAGEVTDPLLALLMVDRINPSAYSYEQEIKLLM